MTQIITVSATTAGYVMDALKPNLRVSRSLKKAEGDSSIQKLSPDADAGSTSVWSNATPSQAISLFFLTADLPEQGQTTQAEVESAYREQTEGAEDPKQIVEDALGLPETIEG